MRISDWSSDVCSSDLDRLPVRLTDGAQRWVGEQVVASLGEPAPRLHLDAPLLHDLLVRVALEERVRLDLVHGRHHVRVLDEVDQRSEEHTSELQSLMRISYAVFCLKKKNIHPSHTHYISPYYSNT